MLVYVCDSSAKGYHMRLSSTMTGEERTTFRYEFPLNVDTFEATTKFGLTMNEAMIVMGAGVVPTLFITSVSGLVLGVVVAVVAFVCIQKHARFGGVALPVYVYQRLKSTLGSEHVKLNQIVPKVQAEITRKTYRGDRIATYKKE